MNIDIAGMLLSGIFQALGLYWAAITSSPWIFVLVVGLIVLAIVANIISPNRRRSRRTYRR